MNAKHNIGEKKDKKYPLRTDAVVRLRSGKKIPVTVSCRSDGACVILPRSMKELIFPKVVKKGEKKEVK